MTKKPKLRALLDDDDAPPPKPATVKPKRLAALMDDDDAPAPKQIGKPVKKETPAPAIQHVPKIGQPPTEFFNIQTASGVRIQIIDRMGSDWSELLCYNWDMKVTMHLKRSDLVPVDLVTESIQFIKTQLRADK